MIRTLTFTIGLYAVLTAALAVWVYSNAFRAELAATADAGDVRLAEASSRLRGQLDVYRTLVNIIAQDQRMIDALGSTDTARVDPVLKDFSLTFGAWEVDLIDTQGRILSSSHPERDGITISPRLVTAVRNRRLGYELDLIGTTRLVRFARTVSGPDGTTLGGTVVSADLEELEFEWPVSPEPIIFFDDTGLAVSSNRPELLLLRKDSDGDSRFPLTRSGDAGPFALWTYAPDETHTEVLVLTRLIRLLDLDATVLLDTAPARDTARLRMLLAVAVMTMLGLIGAVMMQQRRRLSMETSHSATLEARVEARTAELRAAQDELVATSKLAALGRLSAGVSHEINQPLGAIMNFAENGRKLLDKGRGADAGENFGRISDQVRRITRIITNLRAFARQEDTPVERVDLVQITRNAVDLMTPDLATHGVAVTTTLPDVPVPVMAGRVRLEQVIVNLLSNACDAMQASPEKTLTILLVRSGAQATLSVRDTGSGIQDMDQVFEPFYTTKELGASKGLGMGLALSYGIVTRFGGQLACRNTGSGAEFTLTLDVAEAEG